MEKKKVEGNVKGEEMLDEKAWQEFRGAGLLFFINQILHAFGWAIVIELGEGGKIKRAFPARTKFRGFGPDSIDRGYRNLSKFMKENADELYKEAHEI